MRTPQKGTLWGELSRYSGKEMEVLVKMRGHEKNCRRFDNTPRTRKTPSDRTLKLAPRSVEALLLRIPCAMQTYRDFGSEPGLCADFKAKLRFVCP